MVAKGRKRIAPERQHVLRLGAEGTTKISIVRPKRWVCNSRTPSKFSGGYKRLWSANNCSGTAKLYAR